VTEDLLNKYIRDGMPKILIAKELGISRQTINKRRIAMYGDQTKKRKPTNKPGRIKTADVTIDEEQREIIQCGRSGVQSEEVISLYNFGMSMTKIAEMYGVSRSVIRPILTRNGYTIRD